MRMHRSDLDRRLQIERPVSDPAIDGAGSGSWAPVTKVWAQVQDALPSRGERLADGINIASRPARVRMDYRTGITPDMRFVLLRREGAGWVPDDRIMQPDDRIMQIVAGPAELGRRETLEWVVEDYSPAGNPA